jgi:hypothetical protein
MRMNNRNNQELKGASSQTGDAEVQALSSGTSIWPDYSATFDASIMRTRDNNQTDITPHHTLPEPRDVSPN